MGVEVRGQRKASSSIAFYVCFVLCFDDDVCFSEVFFFFLRLDLSLNLEFTNSARLCYVGDEELNSGPHAEQAFY